MDKCYASIALAWMSLSNSMVTPKIKLFQYSKRKPCYYCGSLSNIDKEHIPPRIMFNGFVCDAITVPACPIHNSEKHIGDRAIVTAMAMSAYVAWKNFPTSAQLTENVVKAIKALEPNFDQAKDKVWLDNFLINPPPELNTQDLDIKVPYLVDDKTTRLHAWMRQLTAGLVWSVIGQRDERILWNDALVWSPNYLRAAQPRDWIKSATSFLEGEGLETLLKSFFWHSGWSSKPTSYPSDIYSFDICFPSIVEGEENGRIIFRHRFYNGTAVWYVGFSVPRDTKGYLFEIVGST